MTDLRIGFIGGCINKQDGMKRHDLFHFQLHTLLQKYSQIDTYKILLGSYWSYNQLVEKVQDFLIKKRPDILFLLVRPQPLMPLHKPFIKYDQLDNKQGLAFHPALFNRKLEWKKEIMFKNVDEEPERQQRKIALRDINLGLGFCLGLHDWSMRYICQELQVIRKYCEEKNIKFYIILPPKNPESIMGNVVCNLTARYLKKDAIKNDYGYLNMNLFSLDHFEQDNIHLNVKGHKSLAGLLFQEVIKVQTAEKLHISI